MCALSLLHICFPCKIKFLASFHSIFSTVFTFHAIALCVSSDAIFTGFLGCLGWALAVVGQGAAEQWHLQRSATCVGAPLHW